MCLIERKMYTKRMLQRVYYNNSTIVVKNYFNVAQNFNKYHIFCLLHRIQQQTDKANKLIMFELDEVFAMWQQIYIYTVRCVWIWIWIWNEPCIATNQPDLSLNMKVVCVVLFVVQKINNKKEETKRWTFHLAMTKFDARHISTRSILSSLDEWKIELSTSWNSVKQGVEIAI